MNKYFERLIELSTIAYENDEVPVSALIVYNGKIISESYNSRIKNNSVLNHAEIDAIKKANEKLRDWRLDECDLYVTLEPCDMCKEIIYASRIRNVYYLINRLENKKKFSKTVFINCENDQDKYSTIIKEKMSSFFAEKRDK